MKRIAIGFFAAALVAAFSYPAFAQQGLAFSSVRTVAPTATVFSSVLARTDTRTSCVITNIGTTQGYCQFKTGTGVVPTIATSVPVNANGSQFLCSVPGSSVTVQDEVDCTCASGTCAFVVNATGQ